MKRAYCCILSALLMSMLAGCVSTSSSVSPTDPRPKKGAISLRFQGDPLLNLYQGKPHSLIVCVYHLKDLNRFRQLTEKGGGLSKLLECRRFDPGVTCAKRLVVQPGQELGESLDPAAGADFVGVVAGYYSLHKVHSVRSYQIPASTPDKPGKLDINLHMGPEGIQEIKEKQ